MDLRPVNPYYKQNILVPQTDTYRLAEPYTYPYAWIEPVTDRKQEDVEELKELSALEWNHMTDAQKDLWLYGTETPNLIETPYFNSSFETNGITFFVNGDGSVTANGTATDTATFFARNRNEGFSLPEGAYYFSGCPRGGGADKYYMMFDAHKDGAFVKSMRWDFGEGKANVITKEDSQAGYVYVLAIRIAKGTACSNLTFHPMLNKGTARPYRKREITGHKGALNRQDLERIENNIQILMDVLEINGTSYAGKVPEFPAESYFARMKENVTAIREGYCVHETTPKVPELPYNTWEKYNAIEQILADVYEVVNAQFNYYAGEEIYTGEETGLLL